MKQFFKFLFASCLGTFFALGGILFFFFLIGSAGSAPVAISDNSILHLKLDGSIPELTNNVPPGQFGLSEGTTIGLNDITRLIKEASDDAKINGILLQTENVSLNPTTAFSLAEVISSFKESGKPVYAYGNYFTQSGYIIASVADSVFLNPNGLVDLRGYGMMMPYFKEFSERTGVDFDIYFAGKYKSAIEPFYRNESSDENRFQTRAYLQQYHNHLVNHIARWRQTEIDRIDEVVTGGLSNNASDAINFQLVDRLSYKEDVLAKIEEGWNSTSYVELKKYFNSHPKSRSNNNNKIAVVYAEGEVAFDGEERGNISMDRYDEVFDRLIKNKNVGAVVLRVNSPGGSSFTSDRFLKRINDLREAGKYVVASFGDYAASGGYYIAAGADKIVSQPTTLTGSIGVFSMMPDLSELSEEELGIYWDTIGTGKRTFMYSSFIPRSEKDNALLMAETERIYEQFKTIVAQGRALSLQEVEEVAQGRVWSGADAIQIGLVDTLGGLAEAIHIAADEVDYDQYKILEYPIIEKDFWELMIESFNENTQVHINETRLKHTAIQQIMETLHIVEAACTTPQARLPFSFSVH